MRYYIADCHFYHRALLDKMDHRGFDSVEQMNDYMLTQWNSVVRKNDEVVILGDLSYGNSIETNDLIHQLNGRLYLIIGNHDNFIKNKDIDISRFNWIGHYKELSDEGRKVVCSHYPIACYNGQYRRDENDNPKVYMLYGHVHDTVDEKLLNEYILKIKNTKREGIDGIVRNIPCNMINCFCMFSDYKPLTLDQWIELDNKRRLALISK